MNTGNFKRITREIELLKSAIKPITTNNPMAAFAYGLGRYSWTWAAVLVAGMGVWLQHLRETTTTGFQQARIVVERYPNLVLLEPVVKSAKLVERKEGTFLEIAPARGKLVIGQSYVVNPSQRMEEDAPKILIPLRFK